MKTNMVYECLELAWEQDDEVSKHWFGMAMCSQAEEET